MRRVADEGDAGARRDPGRQRVAVDEFPVEAGRRQRDDGAHDRVPGGDEAGCVRDGAGGGPAFADVGRVLL